MADPKPQGLGALASVLQRDLNSIEDLPSYVQPPPGVYKLLIKDCASKLDAKERQVINVNYMLLENVSLADAQGDAEELKGIKMGKDLIGETFYFNDPEKLEQTLSYMKKQFGGLGGALGETNLLKILEKMPNLTATATIGRRVDENDKTKYYASVRNLVPAV